MNLPNNIFRIVVKDPTTIVKRNGVVLTGLINNTYYEYYNDAVPPATSSGSTNNTVDVIDADNPYLLHNIFLLEEIVEIIKLLDHRK